jgi:pimeloyl-ACP methyl ester carboxylesterase
VTSISTDLPVQYYTGRDGVQLAYRELGAGRPFVLIHGYFSTATVNWIKYGHAALIASRGYRVIMPDLRAHGDSAKPHDKAAYPPDVLADDGFALLDHLGLTDYDLGGYSLGARTTIRMLIRGATPRRAIAAGVGLDGLVHATGRSSFFRNVLTNLGSFDRSSPEWRAEMFLKTVGGDPVAFLNILDTFVDTPYDELTRITTPLLVVSGVDDHDNGSAAKVAETIPGAQYVEIPGNHMSAVTRPELGAAMADFLGDGTTVPV